jgi:23S rRNA pseudoU1915 N3-methylase RlmH
MIDMLTEENRKLRDELSVYNRKVSRLQKFEFEIQKVHEAYESLVKSSQKREKLESIMKKKLKEELIKLQATNKKLQGETFNFYNVRLSEKKPSSSRVLGIRPP